MRSEIPRSPRTLRKKEDKQKGAQQKPTLWDKVLKTGPFIVSVSSLFVSITAMLIILTVNGPQVIKNGKDLAVWYSTDQDVSGRWTNSSEGDIDPPSWSVSEDDSVYLDIGAYKGEISGMVISKRLCKYSPYTAVNVEGRIDGDRGAFIFWDHIKGERQAFAKGKFHINRAAGLLEFEITEQAPNLFSNTFTVGKRQGVTGLDERGDESADLSTKEKEAQKTIRDMEEAQYRGGFCKEFFDAIRKKEGGKRKPVEELSVQ